MSAASFSVGDRVVLFSNMSIEWCAGLVIDIYQDHSILVLFYINDTYNRKRISADSVFVKPEGAMENAFPYDYYRTFIKGNREEAWRRLRLFRNDCIHGHTEGQDIG